MLKNKRANYEETWKIFKCTEESERTNMGKPDSKYVTFWKRQNYEDVEGYIVEGGRGRER